MQEVQTIMILVLLQSYAGDQERLHRLEVGHETQSVLQEHGNVPESLSPVEFSRERLICYLRDFGVGNFELSKPFNILDAHSQPHEVMGELLLHPLGVVMRVYHHQFLLHQLQLRAWILNHDLACCGNLKNAWEVYFELRSAA